MSLERSGLKSKSKKIKISLILILTLCLVSIVVVVKDSVSLEQFQESSAQEYILDNGMTVITKRIATSPLVSLVLVVKAGSATEGKFLGSGISHFVEHLLFKGTDKRKAGQIFREIESLGGQINGFTSYDYTGYTITLPKRELNKGLEILADAIINSQFDPQEIEKEREVILSELRLYKDDPGRRIYRLLFSNAYTQHPYRHPIIGYEPLLKSLTRDDLLQYYKKMYIPNNIVLAVAGDVNQKDILSRIKDEFREFPMRPYVLSDISPDPKQLSRRRIEEKYPTKLTRMFLGFKGTGIANQDLFALDVLAVVLGQGESSRLYREIYKNKGLVYSIDSPNFTLMDGGIFVVRCTLEKEKAEEAVKAILSEIDKIKKEKINTQELQKAKRQVISSYIFSRQTTAEVARDLAISEVLTGDLDFSKKYVEAVKVMRKDDIQNVAKKYLHKETLTIAILNPVGLTEEGKLQPQQKVKSEIKKVVLDNGLTVLLREDSSYPIVSIKAIFGGGLRLEKEDKNGLSNLTSLMLLRGTKSRSAETIAEVIESLGGSIEAFSGNNSFGISLDILSEDVETGISLLDDIITNSVFPEEELVREKDVVASQIKAKYDSIFKLAYKSLKKILFKTHPYRFDPLGGEESLKTISRQDVVEFYRNFCVPNNMVLAIFGDIKSQDLLELIKDKFGRLAPKELTYISPTESFHKKLKETTIHTSKEQAVIMLGFPGVKLTDPERYPLEVLNSILTSMGGRLYQKIREELGQAYTLGGNSVPGVEPGFYYLYVSTTSENLDKIREIVLREIQDLQTNYIDAKELSTAKTYLIGSQEVNLETNYSLALQSGLDELYGLGFDNYKLYQEKISNVTVEDIMRIAKLYLNSNNMAIVIVEPKESPTFSNSKQKVSLR